MAVSNEQVVALIKKNPIATVCLVVTLGVIAALYFRSGLTAVAEADLEQKTKEGRRMAANIKFAAQLDEQLAAVTAANATINRRLVRASELANNLQYFYRLENDTGIKLVDLRQVSIAGDTRAKPKNAPKTAFEPVNYAVAVQGTFNQLVGFLQRLEHGEHFSRIQTATFMPAAGIGGEEAAGSATRPEMLTLTLSVDLLGQP